MRKLKEILRLKHSAQLSNRQISKSVNVSPATVSKYLARAEEQGWSWPLPDGVTESDIDRALYKNPVFRKSGFVMPDFSLMHQELKRKGVTKQLLWEEYKSIHKEDAYSYTQFCHYYRNWSKKSRLSMRQTHRAGEKLFVDYAGPTVPIIDKHTGEVKEANIFIAVLGASNYTYAEATWSQKLPDWLSAHVRAFNFLGGIPECVVPDNLKSGVTKACRYEPDINPSYQQLASFYDLCVLPARPLKPKDKAKVESGVLVVERWILARLRHHTFFSLGELNQEIKRLLESLNSRPFKKLPGSRQSAFNELDKPALRPLPPTPYQYTEIKKAKVHIDYHVEFDQHYYSVPHALVKNPVEIHATDHAIIIYHQDSQVACHVRSFQKSGHSTLAEWTPGRFLNWAYEIGPNTGDFTKKLMGSRPHPEQSYRACLGLLNLAKKYSQERLEAACRRALDIGAYNRKSVASILNKGLDKLPLENNQPSSQGCGSHDNVRGAQYYQ